MTVEGFCFTVRKIVLSRNFYLWYLMIGWIAGDCIVETLAATLPKLVSSLVLAVRGELVPLLLYTISKHKVRLTLLRLLSCLVLGEDGCVSICTAGS
jgi:hypothetical protein